MKTGQVYVIAFNLLVASWCLGCFIATLNPIQLILVVINLICAGLNFWVSKQ